MDEDYLKGVIEGLGGAKALMDEMQTSTAKSSFA